MADNFLLVEILPEFVTGIRAVFLSIDENVDLFAHGC
jgi:hypothetical protein